MRDRHLDDLMEAANPVDDSIATDPAIESAQTEFLDALVETPREAPVSTPTRRRSRWNSPLPRLGIVAAAACAIAVAFLVSGSGSDSTTGTALTTGTAWGAEQVRFAEASPLILLDGWNVVDANEESETTGEMSFRYRSEVRQVLTEADSLRAADLFWKDVPLSEMVRDRAYEATTITTAPVLGKTAKVFMYDHTYLGEKLTDPPVELAAALWSQDGQVIELRTKVHDLESFKERLASLRKVDVDEWLSALPARSIPVADRPAVVDKMLRGVELPRGFDTSDLRTMNLTKDRDVLAWDVADTATCAWFAEWAKARRQGDEGAVQAAVDAMRGSKDWPVVKKDDLLSDVLSEFVAAMPSGLYSGRPLAPEVFGSIGCRDLGISLKNP